MIPKHIDIYGERYKIKIVTGLSHAGECSKLDKIITINKDTTDHMWWTYLHECLHGVFEEGRLDEVIGDDMEEVIIEQVLKFLLRHFTVKPK